MKDEGASDSDLLTTTGAQSSAASTMQQQHQQYLGDVDIVLQNFPEIDWGSTPIPSNVLHCLCTLMFCHTTLTCISSLCLNAVISNLFITVGITDDNLSEFIILYREHCEVSLNGFTKIVVIYITVYACTRLLS